MNSQRFEAGLRALGAQFECIPDARCLVDDTREIHEGDIYVLRQGSVELTPEQVKTFTETAIQAGAVAIIADPCHNLHLSIPVISLEQPHQKLGALAEAFYGKPSLNLKVIGVTGTNGKTTTTYLIENLAKAMGLKVGVLGTVSYRYPGYEEPSALTTPGTLKLYRLMAGMVEAGCDLVAMEISSHGIMQGRIDGVEFDAAIWNNLGTDHLDFHITREAYGLAKRRLFDHYLVHSHSCGKSPIAIANADDDEVIQHISDASPAAWGGRKSSFSVTGKSADVQVSNIVWQKGAWHFDIVTRTGQKCHTSVPLVGEYNVSNAAGAISAMLGIGYQLEELCAAMPKIQQVPGRMQCLHCDPTVIVDYAHTPEALENALKATRSCVPEGGRLCVIFGAGGDRDQSKRPMYGSAAARLADSSIVTTDNPRTEDPQFIASQILDGYPSDRKPPVILDRVRAIQHAILNASERDVILIEGKGHEDYQIIGKTKIHLDDREEAVKALKMRH